MPPVASASTTHALRAAVDSGLLVQTDDAVALRHPLVRSAVYQAAADDDRRRAHRALADSLEQLRGGRPCGLAPCLRRERPCTTRATDHDDDLVDALADVGARSGRRGGYVAALAAYERAASLSTDPARRAGLTVRGRTQRVGVRAGGTGTRTAHRGS